MNRLTFTALGLLTAILALPACGSQDNKTKGGGGDSAADSRGGANGDDAGSDGSGNSSGIDGTGSTGGSETPCIIPEPDPAKSELTFDSTGNPQTLVIHGEDRFKQASGGGFYLVGSGSDIHLSNAEIDGDTITVSESGGLPSFTFRVDTHSRHLSIHLVDVKPESDLDELRDITLEFRFSANASIEGETLDNLAQVGGSSTNREIRWNRLWAGLNDGRLGGAAIYDASLTDSDMDKSLASIWANEPLPIPAGQNCWYEPAILKWVEDYHAQFGGMSEVLLEAKSLDELYKLTDDIAIANDITRVYLHYATWKREGSPNQYGLVEVRPSVFPQGEADLLAYSEYLEENGVQLRLHFLAPSIGKNDPVYHVGHFDRRIAGWGNGTLEEGISASDTTILFRPDAGVKTPEATLAADGLSNNFHTDYIRIGDELIQCSGFNYGYGGGVWALTGCDRSNGANPAESYSKGEEVAGLYLHYGRRIPAQYDLDQPDSLMQELADGYGSFLERVGVDHIHLDGEALLEVSPGSARDFEDRLYSHMSIPTTSSRVGSSIKANFEQRFSALRDDKGYGYFYLMVGFREDEAADAPSTSWLHIHYGVQESIMKGGRRPFLEVPESGQGVSQARMDMHGLSDETIDLFTDWQRLGPVLHDDDVAYIGDVTTRMSSGGRYESEYILVLGQNGAGDYIFTPRHIMGRSNGSDYASYVKQEHGATLREQAFNVGGSVTVSNPLDAQAMSFMISVDDAESGSLVNPTISISGGGSMTVSGTVKPGYYLMYEASTGEIGIYDENWNLQSKPSFTTSGGFQMPAGNASISVDHTGSSGIGLETQFIVDGDEYVLKTNENL